MEVRGVYHKRLQEIQDDVIAIGDLVGDALCASVEALRERNMDEARRIVAGDRVINERRFRIEEKCVELIATQQPLASDLRLIVAILNITTEIERIGDYAAGNGKIVLMIGDEPYLIGFEPFARMGDQTVSMLRRSLRAFVDHDLEAAKAISEEDDVVDNLYDQIFHELLGVMTKDPSMVAQATRRMWLAHNLERAADRITNICERIVFVATGKMEEMG